MPCVYVSAKSWYNVMKLWWQRAPTRPLVQFEDAQSISSSCQCLRESSIPVGWAATASPEAVGKAPCKSDAPLQCQDVKTTLRWAMTGLWIMTFVAFVFVRDVLHISQVASWPVWPAVRCACAKLQPSSNGTLSHPPTITHSKGWKHWATVPQSFRPPGKTAGKEMTPFADHPLFCRLVHKPASHSLSVLCISDSQFLILNQQWKICQLWCLSDTTHTVQ